MEECQHVWMNGKIILWSDAKIHFLTHSLHYGTAVFEGIRCYNTEKGPAIFRLGDHIKRLFDSAAIVRMEIPFSFDDVCEAHKEVVRKNKLKECYIRPIAFFGYGQMGLSTKGCKVDMGIAAWPWGAYLGDEGIKNGIRLKVSSYSRHSVNSMMTKAKVSGAYVNSTLAKLEALDAGCDEAIMLDSQGYIAEGSGENFFIVENGAIITPPITNALRGITRDSVIQIAKDMGIEVKEEDITRDRAYVANEAFMTGTAAEVVPVREIDGIRIGEGRPGAVTKKLQAKFYEIIKGKDPKYGKWLDLV